jgi:uncharacterized protein YndB with AHSA1/START domain
MDFQGKISYGRFLFIQINPYDLLEFTNSFSNEQANVVKAPFDIPLPLEILYRISFIEKKQKTTLTLTGQPVNSTQEEDATFDSINDSMQEGFGATFDQLDIYLAKIQTNRNR